MSFLKVKKSPGLLRLTLSRPDKSNAFHPELMKEIARAFQAIPNDVRVVLLTAEGKNFCAGADLEWMKKSASLSREENLEDLAQLRKMYEAIAKCEVPVVVRCKGRVMGGGVGLVAASDIAIADDATLFCLSEARWGLIPGLISPFVISKIGLSRFLTHALTALDFTAAEALSSGLVSFIGAPNAVEEHLQKMIGAIMRNAPDSVKQIKKLTRRFHDPIHAIHELDLLRSIAEKRISPEALEGLAAFFEKRDPSWSASKGTT
jgi:methylglutaconyl-CoA hydratase